MKISPSFRRRRKPTILLILQGQHHLMLYRELFVRCQQFHWVCILDNPKSLPKDLIENFYNLYGVQVFSDERTALSNFLGIDAVITTFAVPHPAHSRFINYLALAYEMGMPVFEMQHGLFQLGISYSEQSAFVGAGLPDALTSLNAPNLTQKKFVWADANSENEVSVGYPPYVNDVFESPAFQRKNADSVLIASNMHWNILNEKDVALAWDFLVNLFKNLPEINFILMPHPGEMKSAHLRRGLERCETNGIDNLEVQRPQDRNDFLEMLEKTKLAISMVSTVLLDFEMHGIPCIILPCLKQKPLISGLQYAQCPSTKKDFVSQVSDTFYGNSQATLRTGALRKFRPDILSQVVMNELPKKRMPISQAVPLIAKYVQGVN